MRRGRKTIPFVETRVRGACRGKHAANRGKVGKCAEQYSESAFAVDEHAAYSVRAHECVHVRHDVVAYTLVARPRNLAFRHHVPERYAVRGEETFLFVVGRRRFFAEVFRKRAPEPVLRMSVIKIRFPRFDAWETAQNKGVTFALAEGTETCRSHAAMLTRRAEIVNHTEICAFELCAKDNGGIIFIILFRRRAAVGRQEEI